ncbi:MAG: DUF3822 family protein [Sphingobacteriales bacterium]|nr:MAG: DUF3822 family protein [Sphingobacteriales bacterium]
MNEPVYNYKDGNFSLDQAGSYILLLQVNTNSFAYAVTHNNKLLAWGNAAIDELLNPVELKDLLSAGYQKVITGLPATGFTLIPETIYSDDHIKDFARYLNVQADESVFVQQLDSENRIIYKVAANPAEAGDVFGLENTVFGVKGWIKAVAGSNPSDDTLYADISGNRVFFLYYTYGKLRYFNRFEFTNADELAYYAALVTDQLKLQPKRTSICLSGEVDKDDENTGRLAQFFAEVDTTNLTILQLPGTVAPHHILSLAALALCG